MLRARDVINQILFCLIVVIWNWCSKRFEATQLLHLDSARPNNVLMHLGMRRLRSSWLSS